MELLERLADIQMLLREGALALRLYREALELFQDLDKGDKWIAIRLYRKIGETRFRVMTIERERSLEAEVQTQLRKGLALIEGQAPHKETVRLLTITSICVRYWHYPSSDWQKPEEYAQAAIEMAERLDAPVELSSALDALATLYNRRGDIRNYLLLEQRRQQLSLDPRFDDLREKFDILVQNATVLKKVGDHAQAIPLLLEAEKLAVRIQESRYQVRTLYLQAECWVHLDRWDEVLLAEEKGQAIQRRYPINRVGSMCWLLAFSSTVHALRGEKQIAAQLADESYAMMLGIATGNESNWESAQFY